MKTLLNFLTCFAILAYASGGHADEFKIEKGHDSECCCNKRAHQKALEVNAGISESFTLNVPSTALEGAELYTSFFAEDGVSQSPFGTLRGTDEIFASFLAYGQNPGEMDQHVITRKTYWDPAKATLVVERTWFATLTVARDFAGTVLPAGTTYSQDDCVVIRFACDHHCHSNCILPGKVVYYREYFDPNQFESIYTDDYPEVCHRLGEK